MFMHNYNQEQKMKIKHIHKIFLRVIQLHD